MFRTKSKCTDDQLKFQKSQKGLFVIDFSIKRKDRLY